MDDPSTLETSAIIEVPAHGQGHGESPDVMSVSNQMLVLTWAAFLVVAFVLYKVAWKPILEGLDKREADIRKALENAEQARRELARIEEVRKQTIAEADAKAHEILDAARKGALEAASVIENKARQEAQILVDTAQREIRSAQEKAIDGIRRETAILAVDISRKIMRSQFDETKGRALAQELISHL